MINQNIMQYFLCPCCPKRLQNRCAGWLHTLLFIMVMTALIFSIVNVAVGPNSALFQAQDFLDLGDEDALNTEHHIIMQSSVYYDSARSETVEKTYLIDDVTTVRNTVALQCV